MKHFKPNAWTHHEMTPERTAEWFKRQSDEQIAHLRAHNVWYGPEHLRPAPVEPELEPEPDIRPGMSLSERIVVLCAHSQSIDVARMMGNQRGGHPVVRARQLAVHLIHKHCRSDSGEPMGNAEIGQVIGGRDRTTVLHSLKVVNADLAAGGERFGAIIESVETELGLR